MQLFFRKLSFFKIVLVIISLLSWPSIVLSSDHSKSVQVIVHPIAQTATLNSRQLLRIYTLQQKRWPNGRKIKVYTLPLLTPTHQLFVKKVLRSQTYQLERHWKRLLFSGIGKAPTQIDDEKAMIDMVRNTPGAIGYISSTTSAPPELILQVK